MQFRLQQSSFFTLSNPFEFIGNNIILKTKLLYKSENTYVSIRFSPFYVCAKTSLSHFKTVSISIIAFLAYIYRTKSRAYTFRLNF